MKIRIIHCKWLNVAGLAMFPFILLKYKPDLKNERIIRHEYIHIKQQLELFIIPFYFLYVLNYVINLLVYLNHRKAYFNIVFEKEAYLNDSDEQYLNYRRRWAFVKYFGVKFNKF